MEARASELLERSEAQRRIRLGHRAGAPGTGVPACRGAGVPAVSCFSCWVSCVCLSADQGETVAPAHTVHAVQDATETCHMQRLASQVVKPMFDLIKASKVHTNSDPTVTTKINPKSI